MRRPASPQVGYKLFTAVGGLISGRQPVAAVAQETGYFLMVNATEYWVFSQVITIWPPPPALFTAIVN